MHINNIKKHLDNLFATESYPNDGWDFTNSSNEYIEDSFKKNKLGLMLKNSECVNYVYTATFPDEMVLNKILTERRPNSLLFTHHPKNWDSSNNDSPFIEIEIKSLQKLRDNKISIYALHTPLDKNGEYSTSINLAKALDFEIISDFYNSNGIYKGVLCNCEYKTIQNLMNHISAIFQHDVGLSINGEEEILNGKVCVVAGGGMIPKVIDEMKKIKINTYITGAIIRNEKFRNSVDFCNRIRNDKINVIIGSHQTTEKYACIKMIEYFKSLGLKSKFIEGKVNRNDWLQLISSAG